MKINEEELMNLFEGIKELNEMDFDNVYFNESLIDISRKSGFTEGMKITICFENYEKENPGKFLHKLKYGIDKD